MEFLVEKYNYWPVHSSIQFFYKLNWLRVKYLNVQKSSVPIDWSLPNFIGFYLHFEGYYAK